MPRPAARRATGRGRARRSGRSRRSAAGRRGTRCRRWSRPWRSRTLPRPGVSPAAVIASGNAMAMPSPHSKRADIADGQRPAPSSSTDDARPRRPPRPTRRLGTRPNRVDHRLPTTRPTVIATAKTAKPSAAAAPDASRSSASINASQSFAAALGPGRAEGHHAETDQPQASRIRARSARARGARPRRASRRRPPCASGMMRTASTAAPPTTRRASAKCAAGARPARAASAPNAGAEHGADAPAGVEAGHQVAAAALLDLVAGHVHRDVPDADAGADDEQHRGEHHQVRRQAERRVGEHAHHDADEQHPTGADPADEPAGQRHRDQRADRGEEQGEAEAPLVGAEVVADRRDAGDPGGEQSAVGREHDPGGPSLPAYGDGLRAGRLGRPLHGESLGERCLGVVRGDGGVRSRRTAAKQSADARSSGKPMVRMASSPSTPSSTPSTTSRARWPRRRVAPYAASRAVTASSDHHPEGGAVVLARHDHQVRDEHGRRQQRGDCREQVDRPGARCHGPHPVPLG